MQNCCAEIVPESGKQLEYRSAGCEGRIDVEVTSPGKWGSIYASHHPPLSKLRNLFLSSSSDTDKCPGLLQHPEQSEGATSA